VEFIYAQVIPRAARELAVDPAAAGMKVVVVVSVAGYSPRVPFATQWASRREREPRGNDAPTPDGATAIEARWKADEREMSRRVWGMLESGAAPADVQAALDAGQAWPWMAVACEPRTLEQKLHAMFGLAECELDMSPDPTPLPGGFAVTGILYTRAARRRLRH
jgi:hypothetical protein